MYLEFFIPLLHYFRTIKRSEFIYEWLLPFFVSLFYMYFLCLGKVEAPELNNISVVVINILAILIGFSITSITLISTVNSKNIENLKSYDTKRKIGPKSINLYQLKFINLSFALTEEIFLMIFNLIFQFFSSKISDTILYIYLVLNFFFLSNILLLNLRNVTNLYFVLVKKDMK